MNEASPDREHGDSLGLSSSPNVAANVSKTARGLSKFDRLVRQAVLRRLGAIEYGSLNIHYPGGTCHFQGSAERRPAFAPSKEGGSEHSMDVDDGPADAMMTGEMRVHNERFFRRAALGGGLGAAESYIRGEWDSPELVQLMRVLARNSNVLSGVEKGMARLLRPVRAAMNWMRRNTRAGSRRNIAAHYDLSNDFFALMLDPSMTYSSGIFEDAEASLEDASVEKYDRICRKLDLRPDDHVLEIGTGWGGFAEHAVKNYGCQITTTTISQEQFAFAQQRLQRAGVSNRANLLLQDYRDLQGQYDKLVSIEMIEAVGEKFLPSYFEQCSKLLRPDGAMCLQAITIPDHRYDRYRRSVDFIQRYIFPGGFLPSFSAITRALKDHTDFRLFHSVDFGPHYATTLAHWRHNFWSQIDAVRQLGFDETFIRTWHYYLCYCEAGFAERQIGVSQIVLTKPNARLVPSL